MVFRILSTQMLVRNIRSVCATLCFVVTIIWIFAVFIKLPTSGILTLSSSHHTDCCKLSVHGVQRHNRESVVLSESRNVTKLVYNRVPKTASGSINDVLRRLSQNNNFTWESSNIFLEYNISVGAQERLAEKINSQRSLYAFDRHLHYVNFSRFINDSVIYINVVRDPLERLVSWYYFTRFDHPRKMSNERRTQTYDQCVTKRLPECVSPENYFQQISFFCGQDDFCRVPSRQALQQAKLSVEQNFAVVGLTEELSLFFQLLELQLPQYFKDAVKLYSISEDYMHRVTQTSKKSPVSASTKTHMDVLLSYDYEFYYFVKQRFYKQAVLMLEKKDHV